MPRGLQGAQDQRAQDVCFGSAQPALLALSRNEELVLAILRSAGGPMKAYALLDQLHEEGLRAPMTVYRALKSLTKRGLVRKIASRNAYVATRLQTKDSVEAYVICSRCGSARSISVSASALAALFGPAHTTINDVMIEAYGVCPGENGAQCSRAQA